MCQTMLLDGDRRLQSDETSSINLLTSLKIRAEALLAEFKAFRAHLESQHKQHDVELRIFRRGVESEVKSLTKITQRMSVSDSTYNASDSEEAEQLQLHALRSSNLSFYEAVWGVAKASNAISALGKRVYVECDPLQVDETCDSLRGKSPSSKRKDIPVDIVTENGLEWIKVSTINEKRLLFEMAKEGWENYGDLSNTSDTDDSEQPPSRKPSKLELVRLAEDLQAASKTVRVQFKHPRVHFVLPNIQEGSCPDIDAFLADIRATGASAQCGTSSKDIHQSREAFNFDRMTPALAPVPLTPTVNVDCTILLALISDISHLRRQDMSPGCNPTSATFHKAIQRQIESEETHPLLPKEVYPYLLNRSLHCTSHAAQRMREIVQCMGTVTEQLRADIILGERSFQDQSSAELRLALSKQSRHAVSETLRLPIIIIDFEPTDYLSITSREGPKTDQQKDNFPSSIAARAISKLHLTDINTSVFMYGWTHEIVTITSNRAVANALLASINNLLDEGEQRSWEPNDDREDFLGPHIYVCESARSLVGKPKGKAGG
ncbi:uncharacterized protein PV06_07404 [Exophiala oligosperma]|uniref:DUF1308 domain-containing protein n=1 Tax=Exophiala oligosperma TaxID=215243 RepID=A0A0D2DAP8_9EURO|nr:uncharacterized protein PV06_07404 [Exophiala oligosperma]KIW40183.1 hypothetical protein PV06_07404 [Exophiala oligosperma]